MRYPNAALGLKLMFLGQILAIAGFLLFWVPLVGFLLASIRPEPTTRTTGAPWCSPPLSWRWAWWRAF